ncbi:MAG: T9SS type A sorting domain-containing protein [Calditrichaeota bacterium]|nr:T9SS type A sorting domain-containing protein [Calditrichota bacterium]
MSKNDRLLNLVTTFLVFFVIFLLPLHADTFIVETTSDSAGHSLFWAVSQAQQHVGPDTILFNIPQGDENFDGRVWKIMILQPLPALNDDGTFIDGFSQSRNQGETNGDGLELELHGELCPENTPGLQINSAHNKIKGLAIGGFNGSGIVLQGASAQEDTIAGCYIGTNAGGTDSLANAGDGIECKNAAGHNVFGGTSTADRNVISGNKWYGIRFEESCSNKIIGNYIGVDAAGLTALPNGGSFKKYAGVIISFNSKNNQVGDGTAGGRNVISGNYRTGLRLEYSGTDSNSVQGNYLGLGADGLTAIPNGEAGLVIGRGASYNLIGGDEPGMGNVISGNHSSGVQFARASYKNTFQGNYVGTDAAGETVVPNDHNGIYFYGDDTDGYPRYNTIGPDNVICGNGVAPFSQYWAGISMDYSGTEHNTCFGNYIGANPSGTLNKGQPTGVLIQRGAHDNTIGPDNLIVNSAFNGVHVMHDSTIGNKITRNRIYNNGNLAILNEFGGNEELAPPLFTEKDASQVAGEAAPLAQVEIYQDEAGQARLYLGTSQADSNGIFHWDNTSGYSSLTALDIDPQGNTSELAADDALPVELSSFTASAQKASGVFIHWTTASESNNAGFYLQRRTSPAGAFSNVEYIRGHGTTFVENAYEFHDTNLAPGIYYYRLKQVDDDGSVNYSEEITVNLQPLQNGFRLEVYPNPFNSATRIKFYLDRTGFVRVQVFDLLGRTIKILHQGQITQGWHELPWRGVDQSGRDLPSGIYFVRIRFGNKLRMQKIMLLR